MCEPNTHPFAKELIATANAIATAGKGILAADESTGTIGKRFSSIDVTNDEVNRRKYRQLLFQTPGLNEYISGIICYEETLFQKADDGTSFVEIMKKEGIIPGIKVDMGVQPLPGTHGETVTQGIDDLDVRCKKYYEQGARFAKWRAVLHIQQQDDHGNSQISYHAPSQLAMDQNAETLARYAAICQANGLVPIVEPEVLMDGNHSIETSAEVTERVLAAVYKKLADHHVLLEGSLLKPNMVRPGQTSNVPCTSQDIGRATVRVLQHTVPPAVPGITFLSGGMSEQQATEALNAINQYDGKKPWTLTFSYGRALQQGVLHAWKGKDENVQAAQTALLARAKANSEAQRGLYKGENADNVSNESLHVSNYTY